MGQPDITRVQAASVELAPRRLFVIRDFHFRQADERPPVPTTGRSYCYGCSLPDRRPIVKYFNGGLCYPGATVSILPPRPRNTSLAPPIIFGILLVLSMVVLTALWNIALLTDWFRNQPFFTSGAPGYWLFLVGG